MTGIGQLRPVRQIVTNGGVVLNLPSPTADANRQDIASKQTYRRPTDRTRCGFANWQDRGGRDQPVILPGGAWTMLGKNIPHALLRLKK